MLTNIEIKDNKLIAISNGVASFDNIQNSEENNYTSVHNLKCIWNLPDDNSSKIPVTDTDITSRDNLSLVKEVYIEVDGKVQIVELSENNRINNTKNYFVMSSNSDSDYTCSASNETSDNFAWNVFDNTTESTILCEENSSGTITFNFVTDTLINEFYIKGTGLDNGWTIEGSYDGTNFLTIGTYGAYDYILAERGSYFNIQNINAYKSYKIVASGTNQIIIETLSYIDPEIGSKIIIDNATKIFNLKNTVDFSFLINDIDLTYQTKKVANKKEDKLSQEFIMSEKLNIVQLYENVTLSAYDTLDVNEFKTNINFKINTELVSLSYDIFKNTNKPI
jgi:hypothetical protein